MSVSFESIGHVFEALDEHPQSTLEELMDATHLSRRTVQRALDVLLTKAQVEKLEPGGGRGHRAVYRPAPGDPPARTDAQLKKYGISKEVFDALYMAQNGACAVCMTPFRKTASGAKPVVDHCHASEAVRGLLCGHCNKGLGFFKDDPQTLELAAEYLRRNHAKTVSESMPESMSDALETVSETVSEETVPARAILAVEVQEQVLTPPPVAPQTVTAQHVVAWFVDELKKQDIVVVDSLTAQFGRQVKLMLEKGTAPKQIAAGLRRMIERGMIRPHLLPQFVIEAQLPVRPVANPTAMRYGRGMTPAMILKNTPGARELFDASLRGEAIS